MTDLSRSAFDELRKQVQRLCGIALGDDKEYLIRHRLQPVVVAHGLHSLDDLAAQLRQPGGVPLAEAVVEAITTKETSFFRDGHPFEALQRAVLPELVAQANKGARPRLWSAATSTGQEAYSLAILIQELAGPPPPNGDLGILATDISADALTLARQGVYSDRDVARGISPGRLAAHFERSETGWSVLPSLRQRIEFRRANLTTFVTPAASLDLILCRNVLIYFDWPTREDVVNRLAAALKPGGRLLLGTAENLYGMSCELVSESINGTTIYRKPN